MVNDMVLRVASRFFEARDTRDTQLAINQILMREGWSEGVRGKLIKRVKAPFQMSPKVYVLESLPGDVLAVKDSGGSVTSKVDLTHLETPNEIWSAAQKLDKGVPKVVAR